MTDRPRHYAQPISDEVTALIRERLKAVPEQDRVTVVDHVLNGLCIEWNLKKAKAGRK